MVKSTWFHFVGGYTLKKRDAFFIATGCGWVLFETEPCECQKGGYTNWEGTFQRGWRCMAGSTLWAGLKVSRKEGAYLGLILVVL